MKIKNENQGSNKNDGSCGSHVEYTWNKRAWRRKYNQCQMKVQRGEKRLTAQKWGLQSLEYLLLVGDSPRLHRE